MVKSDFWQSILTRSFQGYLLFAMLLALPHSGLPAHTPELMWRVDPGQSSISFTARMLGQSIHGIFPRLHLEELHYPGYTQGLTGRLTIDMDALQTGNSKRDAHLKSEDFFWVDRFPHATVHLLAITEEKGQFLAHFVLEIRGKRREFKEPVTIKADWMTIQGRGKMVLSRKDLGLRGNILTNTIISDEVLIEYAIVLVRK